MNVLPGTALTLIDGAKNSYKERLKPMVASTGGLMLSQVEAVIGIPASTIQNWIKRGWVPQTESKRYTLRQIYRIILINLLRGGMTLDQIADTMAYINGDVDDTSDDIVDDGDLLEYLYNIILEISIMKTADQTVISKVIDNNLVKYKGSKENKEKLKNALLIMSLAYIAGQMKDISNKLYAKIEKELY